MSPVRCFLSLSYDSIHSIGLFDAFLSSNASIKVIWDGLYKSISSVKLGHVFVLSCCWNFEVMSFLIISKAYTARGYEGRRMPGMCGRDLRNPAIRETEF